MIDYRQSRRRLLLDMHVPDWDAAFLAEYDVERTADLYERAGADGVMLYTHSHIGQSMYPTEVGWQHKTLAGREVDVVGDMVAALHRRGIAACGYYSVVFDNLSFLNHPDWRVLSRYDVSHNEAFAGSRYALCCPNNPAYHAHVLAQLAEILGKYEFDAFFFDMAFWRPICVCQHCEARCREATGRSGQPETIDWLSPVWCEYHAMRQRWNVQFMTELTSAVKRARPGIPVYHNAGGIEHDWRFAVPFDITDACDFMGGDFYGTPGQQFLVSKLFAHLSKGRPEFMRPACTHVREHVLLKPAGQYRLEALAAVTLGATPLFIHAVDPQGTLREAVYERIRPVYAEVEQLGPWLGGEPLEDVAVYYSDYSKMSFADNGLTPDEARRESADYPHRTALLGVCRKLQRAHIPFGVVTRQRLDLLPRYRVLVLPNVLRLSHEEIAAVRDYVANGGRLYASRYTSLTIVALPDI